MNNDLEVRRISLETLLEAEKKNTLSHILIKDVLDKYDYLTKFEKSLISTLVKGVIERKIELDYIINIYSNIKTDKMKPVIKVILEMGTYQILYMEVYDTVAVNTSVSLAKKKGFDRLSGFVNAVLRNISRFKEKLDYPDENEPEYLSVKYSAPQFLVDLLLSQYEKEEVEGILKASLDSDNVRFRFREWISPERKEEILNDFADKCIIARNIDGLDNMFALSKSGNISDLEAFQSGEITIQDTASYIFSMNIPKGDRILDACCAPGGKTICMSERFPESEITACDISGEKIARMRSNFERLNCKNVKCQLADAAVTNEDYIEYFDVVVADVPCSGLGVMGKKQDIKYNLSKEGLDSLVSLQEEILDNLTEYVKVGGYLCFSTCTLNKDENERQIERFMKNHDYSYEKATFLPDEFKAFEHETFVKFIQGEADTDGFFFSILKKNGRDKE